MRLLYCLLLSGVALAVAEAQSPSAMPPAQAAWGGYAVPAQIPYQPTMPVESPVEGPVVTYAWPPHAEGGVPPAALPLEVQADTAWQPYPQQNVFVPPGMAAPGAAAYPLQEPLYPATPEPSLRQSLTPPDARNGFFQKAKFTTTWMPQLDDDSLGWTDLRAEVVTALPFFTRENPIIITPSYQLHLLDRPAGFDLPPRLHDLAIDLHVFRVFGNRWIADFALTPGLYADDYSLDRSDAVRVNGRALGVYAPSLEWKYILGVTYVHGAWAKIVPIVGVTYEPNDDVKYEFIFPQPRVAWRLPNSPVPGRDEYWFYIKGEFGNSIWAIEQSDGTPDIFASRDFRALLGIERMIVGGISYRAEIGYVFNRDIKIASISGDDIGLDDTFLVRAGIAY
jgi:hypothetical protein